MDKHHLVCDVVVDVASLASNGSLSPAGDSRHTTEQYTCTSLIKSALVRVVCCIDKNCVRLHSVNVTRRTGAGNGTERARSGAQRAVLELFAHENRKSDANSDGLLYAFLPSAFA